MLQQATACGWVLGLVAAGLGCLVRAASFELTEIEAHPDGRVTVRFPLEDASYYILYRGERVTEILLPTTLRLGGTGVGTLEDGLAVAGRGTQFYRVRQVAVTAPVDVDADGLDDVYELSAGARLNPLDPTDADTDPDNDGRSTLREYRDGTDPFTAEDQGLTTVVGASPGDFESGVSVHRETVIRFSRPLAAGTVLDTGRLHATAGGRRILGRVELSEDRRAATLFHLEPLPGATRVSVILDGTGLTDDRGQPLDADADGLPGGTRVLRFDTFGNLGIAGTAVIGQVFASELGADEQGQPRNRPLQGVIVTVDGAEESLRAVTDAEGRFTLSPAPGGRFFVHVDGRTAVGSSWPNGAYYPFVGKAWEAVPGKTNNLAGGNGVVYLPLVAAGTLQSVSAVQDTRVTFPATTLTRHPELAGVEIQVPANALYHDDGQRGGRVGIAPVPPDRLPEPLPPGLDLPLVITIQTDGPSNFGRPIPVRFPNLPDSATGRRLPPGAKTALVSFDHDTGTWEVAGSMTISADGQFAVTDPGVGVRQPGWHGTSPLCSGGGGGYGNDGPEGQPGGPGGAAGGGSGGGAGAGAGGAGNGDEDDSVEAEDRDGDDDPSDDPPPPEPSDEEGGGPASCATVDYADAASVLLMRPLPPGSGGLPDEFIPPRPEQREDAGKYTDLIGNQHILLDSGIETSSRVRVSWVTRTGTPRVGSGRTFRTRFPPNYTTGYVTNHLCITVKAIAEDGSEQEQFNKMYFKVLPSAGEPFFRLFEMPRDPSDLVEPFRSSVLAFLAAVEEAGIRRHRGNGSTPIDSYKISTIRRQQKRAYLMRFSDIVGQGTRPRGRNPGVPPGRFEDVPPYDPNDRRIVADCDGSAGCAGPLPISWVSLDANGRIDREATVAGALALFSKYGIESRAAFPSSRHGLGKAMDVTFANWSGPKSFRLAHPIQLADGTLQTHTNIAPVACFKISCTDGATREPVGTQHCNEAFRQLGHGYGVFKLECDMPHWEFPDPTP